MNIKEKILLNSNIFYRIWNRDTFINNLFRFILFCELLAFLGALLFGGFPSPILPMAIIVWIWVFGTIIQCIILILYPISKITKKFDFSSWIVFYIFLFSAWKSFLVWSTLQD